MTFIKYLKRTDETKQSLQKRKKGGQSFLEYSLLVVVAIIALLACTFLANTGNAFEDFFQRAVFYITGNSP